MDIRNLVDQYYTFSDGFSQHHRDIDDILKKVRCCFTFHVTLFLRLRSLARKLALVLRLHILTFAVICAFVVSG